MHFSSPPAVMRWGDTQLCKNKQAKCGILWLESYIFALALLMLMWQHPSLNLFQPIPLFLLGDWMMIHVLILIMLLSLLFSQKKINAMEITAGECLFVIFIFTCQICMSWVVPLPYLYRRFILDGPKSLQAKKSESKKQTQLSREKPGKLSPIKKERKRNSLTEASPRGH